MKTLKNNFLFFLISLTFFFFTFCVFAKSPPPGTGKADVKANILLMLDNSGSMGWTSYNANRPINAFDTAVDSSGNIYVTSYYRHHISKYNSSGTFLKKITSYGTGKYGVRYPTSIDIDSNDNVWVLDYYNRQIKSYNSDGIFKCSSNIGGPTYLYDDLEIDTNNNVWVTNYYGRNVLKFDSNCNRRGGIAINDRVGPMAIDSSGNFWYFTVDGSRKLIKYNSSGTRTHTKYLSWGYGQNRATYITDMEADSSGNVYLADLYGNRIIKYDSNTAYQSYFGSYGSNSNQWRYTYGFDIYNDQVYIADFNNHRIQKLSLTGSYVSSVGQSDDRMTIAKRVIKKIVSNSELTNGANFGLMEWGSSSRTKIRVKISDQGAKQIFSDIDNVRPGGGTYLGQAMQKAHNYYKSSDSPINKKANCQNNYVIVISDGDWFGSPNPNSVAKTMLSNDQIRTFVIGFQGYRNKTNYTNLAKAGGTTTPLFADDETVLLQKLTDAIKQVLGSKLTFTSPAIMPDLKYGDHIFQSLFNYQSDSQWQGRLIKYKLKNNGQIGDKVWDAGEKLSLTKSSNRNIWTIGTNYPSGINNFTTSNLSYLKNELYKGTTADTDANANKLINFIRGLDSYDEDNDGSTTDERWKLADIYHSQISIVGPPSAPINTSNSFSDSFYRNTYQYSNFQQSNKNRKSIILAGSNGGMLHAFDAINGNELWGFIPPSVLSNLRNVISSKANSSNSIYAVDGSPVVKDIYYDNKWRTVVITGLGRGGHSYFALDITDINNPEHLFTFSNDPSQKIVSYWDSSGLKSDFSYVSNIPDEFNFSELGEAWSTPRILRLKINNKDKWVAIFGGGFNNGVNPNYGNAIYVIDLENNGKILKKINVADKSGNNVVNSIPASIVPITADGTKLANYHGAIAYFADYENKLWKLNLSDKGTLYDLQEIFDGESNDTNGRRSMHDITASIDTDNNLWIYYGTGDQQQLQKESALIKNRLYGIKDVDFPNYNTNISKFTIAECQDVTSKSSNCPTTNQKGWYINLDANEKTTGQATVYNRTVYFPRYIPNKNNPCNPGEANLTTHDYKCGNTLSKIKLGAGVASTPVIYKGNIYIGLSGATSSSSGSNNGGSTGGSVGSQLPQGWTIKDNLVVGSPPTGRGSGQISVESWRHVF